jgi:hypothetical protein
MSALLFMVRLAPSPYEQSRSRSPYSRSRSTERGALAPTRPLHQPLHAAFSTPRASLKPTLSPVDLETTLGGRRRGRAHRAPRRDMRPRRGETCAPAAASHLLLSLMLVPLEGEECEEEAGSS